MTRAAHTCRSGTRRCAPKSAAFSSKPCVASQNGTKRLARRTWRSCHSTRRGPTSPKSTRRLRCFAIGPLRPTPHHAGSTRASDRTRRISLLAKMACSTSPPGNSMATHNFFTRTALPIRFEAQPPAPERWLQFLKEVTADRQALVDLLQEILGCLISTDLEQEQVFYLLGKSRGGKGTLMKVIHALVGKRNLWRRPSVPWQVNIGHGHYARNRWL